MGTACSCCEGGSEAAQRNKELKKKLKKQQQDDKGLIKLVLIGTGESGKTTIFHQVKREYEKKLDTPAELRSAIPHIARNILEGAAAILVAVGKSDQRLLTQEARNAGSYIIDLAARTEPEKELFELSQQFTDNLAILMNDETFTNMFETRKLQVPDTWDKLVDRLLKGFPEWGGPAWVPTRDDKLLMRVRTTGSTKIKFTIKEKRYQLLDLGGQRNERAKWLPLLKGVDGVIFVAALSDYNLGAFEDQTKNRLTDSLGEWQAIVNNPLFSTAAFILLLNKEDLLEKKFCSLQQPIELDVENMVYHSDPPKYDGNIVPVKGDSVSTANLKVAKEWFKQLYVSKVELSKRDSVYVHFTCALEADKIKTVVEAVHVELLKLLMSEADLMSREV